MSRKCANNKLKLSPATNHQKTKKGPVKGGFCRDDFKQLCEEIFDDLFSYSRKEEEKYAILKARKRLRIIPVNLKGECIEEKECVKNLKSNLTI